MKNTLNIIREPIGLGLILILTLAIYLQVAGFELLNWDDQIYITNNSMVNGQEGLSAAFTQSFEGHYHPLVHLSLRFDYWLGGGKPLLFHLHNLLLHLLNTALVWLLMRRLVNDSRAAFWVSLLFAIHPLQAEAVAWATARKDVLYSAWFLLSLLGWSAYLKERKPVWYVLSLMAFLLSLLSKGQALMLAPLLPLLDYFSGGRERVRKNLLAYLPFFLLAAVFAGAALWAQTETGYTSPASYGVPFHWMAGNAAYALLSYATRILAPFGLSAYYPYPVPGVDIPVWVFWGALPVAIGLVYLSIRFWIKRKVEGIGLMIFLILLLPMLRLLPVSNFITADRYTYLACIGAFMAIYGWAVRLKPRIHTLVMIIFAVMLAGLTINRLPVWKDSLSLLNDTLKKHPDVFPALNSRADIYLDKGNIQEAITDLSRAIALRPGDARAYGNRGRAWAMAGNMDKALPDLDMALMLQPDNTGVRLNRAMARANVGEPRAALEDLDYILNKYPGHRMAAGLKEQILLRGRQH